ncbi:MAG: GFA family protein [Mesorhizobium sp.]|uniref:GFA family protein n=1 Tax=Mesorhizobium sp. TaxID=1871066 RepID=UPI000FE4F2BB|nr:GFA family protein [Mesorhizobium sp.]RWF38605.1 MAG: GFA family protein [Mesorhizobium sp.]
MPLLLKGSCRCNAVRFEVKSHTPVPFMLCYCSICRKQQGGGGFAINLGADYETLNIRGKRSLGVYQAEIEDDEHPHCEISTGERNFCRKCGSALWLYDPTWPDLVHPFASAIDSELPMPPEKVHLMLKYKASWVEPVVGRKDKVFDVYPEESIADWHKRTGMWVD